MPLPHDQRSMKRCSRCNACHKVHAAAENQCGSQNEIELPEVGLDVGNEREIVCPYIIYNRNFNPPRCMRVPNYVRQDRCTTKLTENFNINSKLPTRVVSPLKCFKSTRKKNAKVKSNMFLSETEKSSANKSYALNAIEVEERPRRSSIKESVSETEKSSGNRSDASNAIGVEDRPRRASYVKDLQLEIKNFPNRGNSNTGLRPEHSKTFITNSKRRSSIESSELPNNKKRTPSNNPLENKRHPSYQKNLRASDTHKSLKSGRSGSKTRVPDTPRSSYLRDLEDEIQNAATTSRNHIHETAAALKAEIVKYQKKKLSENKSPLRDRMESKTRTRSSVDSRGPILEEREGDLSEYSTTSIKPKLEDNSDQKFKRFSAANDNYYTEPSSGELEESFNAIEENDRSEHVVEIYISNVQENACLYGEVTGSTAELQTTFEKYMENDVVFLECDESTPKDADCLCSEEENEDEMRDTDASMSAYLKSEVDESCIESGYSRETVAPPVPVAKPGRVRHPVCSLEE